MWSSELNKKLQKQSGKSQVKTTTTYSVPVNVLLLMQPKIAGYNITLPVSHYPPIFTYIFYPILAKFNLDPKSEFYFYFSWIHFY